MLHIFNIKSTKAIEKTKTDMQVFSVTHRNQDQQIYPIRITGYMKNSGLKCSWFNLEQPIELDGLIQKQYGKTITCEGHRCYVLKPNICLNIYNQDWREKPKLLKDNQIEVCFDTPDNNKEYHYSAKCRSLSDGLYQENISVIKGYIPKGSNIITCKPGIYLTDNLIPQTVSLSLGWYADYFMKILKLPIKDPEKFITNLVAELNQDYI